MTHTRRDFIKTTGAGIFAATTALHFPGRAAGITTTLRTPNIVYIMADELGYFELSCMGHPNIKTPNIDGLAAKGIRFTQALAGSSLCAPTRCCLMTGKHSGHASVRKNGGGTPLRAEEETVASVLKRAGYATGGFGKWGCGGRGSTGVPEKHGFDAFVGYYDQVHAHSYYPPYIIRNSEELTLPGNQGGESGQTYSHYVIMDEARKFIKANKDRPFFCYLPVTPPHGLFNIPDEDPAWALYKDKPWPEPARRYAAMVTMLDRQVGELVDLLKKLQLRENTIIFFCGDNGGVNYFADKDHPRGFHGANVNPRTGKAFRGHKGNLYEGGLRIPMVVNWPGKIKPGRVSDLTWYFPDVMPTLAELARVAPPKDTDGISIVPELLGPKAAGRAQTRHDYLYWELGGQVAVRMGHWKAVKPRAAKRRGKKKAEKTEVPWELYNLDEDIEEKNDLAAAHPGLLEKLKACAQKAHTEEREGSFADTANHQRDRWAKWGNSKPAPQLKKVNKLPQAGLIPNKKWRIVRASSESSFNGKVARNAIDGNPRTLWHSKFQGGALPHPHELVIDLGQTWTVRGFRYLARQDVGSNGTLKACEFFLSDNPGSFSAKAAAKAVFKNIKTAQEAACPPTRGRYLLLRTLSAHNNGPWASIAELGVVGSP